MSSQTPRQRAMRPSMNNNGLNFSPSLLEKATTSVHRKASYNALVGQMPQTPAGRILDGDFNVGDAVNVPGDMHGTVKFVGSVRGKQGRFLGVELDQDFAARGKNSGDVEGVSYFNTSIPGSGIFLPVHRAERRDSPALSFGSVSQSPQTPSYGTHRNVRPAGREPPLPTQPKFSQTVGPGARPPSPEFKPKSRQSLPRPESPFRKQPNLQPTPARNFSTSQRIGSRPPVASPAPARSGTPKLSASTRAPPPTRPYSRTGSRLGHRSESISESTGGGASRSTTSTYPRSLRSPSRLDRASDENELVRLREQLQEKDKLLQEQASTLVDMEASLKEIQTLMPSPNSRKTSGYGDEEGDLSQLRQALQEKNENIQSLVTEFDTHRADFRSTIDTLELAANQTEQMYESKIADLLAEMQDLRDNNTSREDVENIATQLKMLEEFVAELEEGLEDARRGEAEARGEVEFLRGEVERGRSELRREREKGASGREEGGQSDLRVQLEMKDDEIRGLRAIVHSLQAGQDAPEEPKRQSSTMQQEEIKRMQETIEQLEQENDDLRSQVHRPHNQFDGAVEHHDAVHSTDELPLPANTKQAGSSNTNGITKGSTWCDACESEGHDMLHCPTLFRNPSGKHLDGAHDEDHDDNHDELSRGIQGLGIKEMGSPENHHDNDDVSPRSPQKEIAPTRTAVEQEKWCALCEQDGHLAFDCPKEQY